MADSLLIQSGVPKEGSAVYRLLENGIDFAGLYPPAKMPAPEAFRHYINILASRHCWVLGHLVWPVTDLENLSTYLEDADVEPIGVSVVGRASTDVESWETARMADVADLNRFMERSDDFATIESYECRIPDLAGIEKYARDLAGFQEAEVFVELPWSGDFSDALAHLAELEWPKAKFRTGGTEASAFPPVATLASFLHQCVGLELEFKLTAGLHDPIGHRDDKLGADYFGFLNALYAVGSVLEFESTPRELESILASQSGADWAVGNTLAFRGQALSSTTIDEVRTLFMSFGSCSVDEPLVGLDKMGAFK